MRRLLTVVAVVIMSLGSGGCAVRYVVLEPEDAAARLQVPVIAHVVNPIVDDASAPIALRVRITAPRDSAVILVFRPAPPVGVAGFEERPSQCGMAPDSTTRIALRFCRLAKPLELVSDSVYLATVEYAPGNNPFNIKRPVKVHLHKDVDSLRVEAGRDTTFHLAVPLRDPRLDYERSRYGVDLSWQTQRVGKANEVLVARNLFERASFRRVNYRWTPVLAGIAFAVVAGSTQR